MIGAYCKGDLTVTIVVVQLFSCLLYPGWSQFVYITVPMRNSLLSLSIMLFIHVFFLSYSLSHPQQAKQVVVCNIHVLYNPKRGEIKLGQVHWWPIWFFLSCWLPVLFETYIASLLLPILVAWPDCIFFVILNLSITTMELHMFNTLIVTLPLY
jgi:hypothetical protein